jgi:hypothetical protein
MGGVNDHIELAKEIKKKRIHPVVVDIISTHCEDGIYNPNEIMEYMDIIEIIMEIEKRCEVAITDDEIDRIFGDWNKSHKASQVIMKLKDLNNWVTIKHKLYEYKN